MAGDERRYLIIVIRATTQSELEAELENQSRRRALAEAKTIEQAKALERANAELTRANRELDEYANIIAHDLKSPMRAVRYFAEDIAQALERNDRQAARKLLGDLQAPGPADVADADRLLAYARIGPNSEEAVSETDTHALAETIIASLPRPRGFTIEVSGEWPVMRTVEPALDLVLRNLIDNAIKHHDRRDGRVSLTAHSTKDGLDDHDRRRRAGDRSEVPRRRSSSRSASSSRGRRRTAAAAASGCRWCARRSKPTAPC